MKIFYDPQTPEISLEQKEKLNDVITYLEGSTIDKIQLNNGQPVQDVPFNFEMRFKKISELLSSKGINNLEKNLQTKPSYINTTVTGDYDILTINYSSNERKAVKYREKIYTQIERSKLLENNGVSGSTKASKIVCDRDTTLFNAFDTKLTLPKCMIKEGFVFKEYPAYDYKRLNMNLTADGDAVNLVSIFRIVSNSTFPKAALLDIQKDQCAAQYELTLKKYDLKAQGFRNGEIVESLQEFNDHNLRYKIVEDGIYILSHQKETEKFTISLEVPDRFNIKGAIVNLTCLGTTYIGTT
ncbi:MAG: hypothetical protein MRY83_18040, partial [Flavobacteriales bacterium]|nr:hypothetical protein [Flavobacteriales bacterium]